MDLRPLHLFLAIPACASAVAALVASAVVTVVRDQPALHVGLGVATSVLVAIALVVVAAKVRERERHSTAAERRRVARELHDGLAQELAFLVTQARIVALSQPGIEGLRPLEAAAQRALDETRLAITGLTRESSETLDVAVEAAVEEVAQREGVEVELELERRIDVPAEVRDAIVRIVREAATNAIRHGRANALRIALSRGEGIRLEVVDDGVGFDPDGVAGAAGHFGLVSMAERARAVGGDMKVVSRPGAGTRIEVAVP